MYSYTNAKSGETIERSFPMNGGRPRRVMLNGQVYLRDIAADHRSGQVNHGPDWKNTWFEFSGINPNQIPEMTEKLAAKGVTVEFHPETGDVKFTGRQNRSDYHSAMGVVDAQGGYGDCTQNRDWS